MKPLFCFCLIAYLLPAASNAQGNTRFFSAFIGGASERGHYFDHAVPQRQVSIVQGRAEGAILGINMGTIRPNQTYQAMSVVWKSQTTKNAPGFPLDSTALPANLYSNTIQVYLERGLMFVRPGKPNFEYYFGYFLRPQWSLHRVSPLESTTYSSSVQQIALSMGFIPRVMLKATKRLWLDISCSVGLGHFSYNRQKSSNPVDPSGSSFADVSATLDTQMRIGATYRW
jgi:hypothetical protein